MRENGDGDGKGMVRVEAPLEKLSWRPSWNERFVETETSQQLVGRKELSHMRAPSLAGWLELLTAA